MYLLDTNIISELRRPRPHGAVLAWLSGIPNEQLHVSAVSIGETQADLEITREQDAAKASEIEAWLEDVSRTYNVLSMDAAAFRAWARRMHRKPEGLIEDAMIAATALVHGLTVATRNVRDFQALRVPIVNPFKHAAC